MIPCALGDALRCFDGQLVRSALTAAAKEGIHIERAVVRRLVDFGVLVADEESKAQRGYSAVPVRLAGRTALSGRLAPQRLGHGLAQANTDSRMPASARRARWFRRCRWRLGSGDGFAGLRLRLR